jgi:putative ABC transport system permease protein
MVRRYFPNEEPIGKLIKIGGAASPFPWMSIIGVVPAVKQSGWTDRVGSEMYVPLLQSVQFLSNPAPHFSYMTVVVRGPATVSRLTAMIRSEIGKLEPSAAVSGVATMEEVLRDKISRPRTAAILSLAFGGIGLVLTTIGVYGVMSYSVSTRTREIGLRTALGAQSADIMRFILREGMILTGGGILTGVLAALALTRLMQGLLFEITPTDPLTFIAVIFVVTSVAILASYIPARRALRVDPLVALRDG